MHSGSSFEIRLSQRSNSVVSEAFSQPMSPAEQRVTHTLTLSLNGNVSIMYPLILIEYSSTN